MLLKYLVYFLYFALTFTLVYSDYDSDRNKRIYRAKVASATLNGPCLGRKGKCKNIHGKCSGTKYRVAECKLPSVCCVKARAQFKRIEGLDASYFE